MLSVFLQPGNLALRPALKDSRGATFSYSSVSIKRSLLVSQIQCRSVPERWGSSKTLHWIPTGARRTGTRRRTDGCGRPGGGRLRGRKRRQADGRHMRNWHLCFMSEGDPLVPTSDVDGATRRPNQNTTPFNIYFF